MTYRWIGIGFVLLVLAFSATAETVYVTDKLLLGMYPEPGATGKPQKTLVSGSQLEQLERITNYARVRDKDGAEGWVKSAYLVTEIPPRLRLTELQQRNEELGEQTVFLQKQLAEAQSQASQLQAKLKETQQELEQQNTSLQQMSQQNQQFLKRLSTDGYTVNWSWALAAVLVSLGLGFLFGLSWLDRRIRKRHGGFRIY